MFGEDLVVHSRSDIKLKGEAGSSLGDVDTLLCGKTVHVLVERKARTGAVSAPGYIEQIKRTREAYSE